MRSFTEEITNASLSHNGLMHVYYFIQFRVNELDENLEEAPSSAPGQLLGSNCVHESGCSHFFPFTRIFMLFSVKQACFTSDLEK